MALTVQEAKNAIQALIDHQKTTGETVITQESLRNIIKDLSLDAGNGKTTVLYSGVGELPTSLTSDPNLRILDNTQAAKFLEQARIGQNPEFVNALKMLYGEQPDLQSSGKGTPANLFVNGDATNPSLQMMSWDVPESSDNKQDL
ncbi:MAG: hypothetical protein AB7D20_07160 [Sulfuricurvum sp.]|uniref:hypothetical protein n=1 Tax=Sulfuricurvum sp. TaxID=2025608 RepID=UPI003D0AE329